MQIGMMGLGRMGANMVRRLMRDGHECVVYDINSASVAGMVKDGAVGAASLEEFVGKLAKPRCAWLMLPAAITGKIVDQVAALMEPGDIIIDGGNSYYHDAVDQAAKLAVKGINFVDVGTSGGVWGLERGYCLMIGGPDEAVKHLDSVFATLAPGADAGTTPDKNAGTA
ncbi:6-phosphogluconate dehydrogenase (decarboxylating), partial [Mesorhizobium sp. M2D.F.Ca.ET.223.01.1.1]